MPKKKSKVTPVDDGGVLLVKCIQAKNVTAIDKRGTSNPYCVVTASFNKQKFKTKVHKKTLSPQWNNTFNFFTTQPEGQINVRLYDHDRWTRDQSLGEVHIPLDKLVNSDPLEAWFNLENEPKKKKSNEKGEILLHLHFPVKQANEIIDGTSVFKTSISSANKTFADEYELGEELGRGGFSIVKKGTHKSTDVVFAIKIIEKNTNSEEFSLLQREIDIMRKLRHSNIISLEEVFEESEYIYLVMELITGGELFDQIINRGTYSERDAANTVRQILEAVDYMHDNGIAHRDLKPENLLCSGLNNEVIKVTDFGLSKDFGQATLKTSCGTPDYVAPEVLKGTSYDNSVDIWSIGVITYILLCGFPPFYGSNDQQIFEKIMRADYNFPSPDWDAISNEAKEFIKAILILDYDKRPTASDCLAAPWIVSKAPSANIQHLESFKGAMTKYTTGRKV